VTDDANGHEYGTPAGNALAALLRDRASRTPAPAALRARVEAALANEIAAARAERPGAPGQRRVAPRRATGSPALAAGLAVLLLAGTAATLHLALPAAARRLAADAVMAAHVEYERLEHEGPTERTSEAGALAARLTAALGVPVRLRAPAAPGVRVTGSAASSLFGDPGAAVFFEADGKLVTLTLVKSAKALPAENRVRLGSRRPMVAAVGDSRLVLWRQGPLFCALAGDLPEAQMTALFDAIRPGLVVGT
jgi:anti-sigma factor RsiW